MAAIFMNGKNEMKRLLIRLFSIFFHLTLVYIYTNLATPDLKANKPLSSVLYGGSEPDVFLFTHNSSSSKTSTFSSFLGTFSNFVPAFFTQFMTETWLTLRILSIRRKPFSSKYSCIAFRLMCSG